MKIVVLLGGESEERDVSLASGAQVAKGLRAMGHDVVSVDPACGLVGVSQEKSHLRGTIPRFPSSEAQDFGSFRGLLEYVDELTTADIVFPVLHGGMGENGTIQAVLDLLEVPYVGSDMFGCALAMNKDLTKRLLRAADISTPDWILPSTVEEVIETLSFPLICKPVDGGSSVGLTLVTNKESLELCFASAKAGGPSLMYENFVSGRELTVGVVGKDTLPVGEIISKNELFDFECKYRPEMADEIFPAAIEERIASTVSKIALEVHDLLGLRDLSRIDFILDEQETLWCLEANTLPGMTANSLLPKAAEAAGFSFQEFCEKLLLLAERRVPRNMHSID
ncbi:MAG TPA: D-alanine--D-alanine ligase [Gemmatimonadetes bacterium]|jgi:D-alanine-D-alanine ligase|nr:D-alanine--D-alanine ligase [Gemmatimonadota bacterium]